MTTELKPSVVLVVDDDPSTRLMVREVLEPAGFVVFEAVDGEDCMARLDEHSPDLILLDIVMPRMDGFQTCAAIRSTRGFLQVPVVMLTGVEDVSAIEKAYELGATDFLAKPLPWLLLEHKVRFILRASRDRAQLERSRARMENAQHAARLGTWDFCLKNRTAEFTERARHLLGVAEEVGDPFQVLLPRVPEPMRDATDQWLQTAIEALEPCVSFEHPVVHEDQSERILRQRAELVLDSAGEPLQVCFVVHDVTDWRRAESEVEYQTYHDSLTGLENRLRFSQRVEDAIQQAQKTGAGLAVLSIGLDRFRQINESLGHQIGDEALRLVAQRIQDRVRTTDALYQGKREAGLTMHVARLTGDEFTILLHPLGKVQDAAKVGWRIVDAFSEPLRCDDHELFLTVSVGISVYPEDGDTVTLLLQSSEAARAYAKEQGRNTVQFSTPAMNSIAVERIKLEASLRRSLDRKELEVYYQPKVDVATGRMVGMEALLRWQHPELGVVSPIGFIPIAEETGLILPISEWLLHEVCGQCVQWQQSFAPFPVSVNFSAEQFRRGDPVQVVERTLSDAGLDGRWLDIELTESVLMRDEGDCVATLRRLKDLGVTISVDDFGTGYSSLSYLRSFPVDKLKIDRSFVSDVPGNPEASALTTAIIRMGQSLGLELVAEGVETTEQLEFLQDRGCEVYQGYLFSPPVPAEIATALLEEERQRQPELLSST